MLSVKPTILVSGPLVRSHSGTGLPVMEFSHKIGLVTGGSHGAASAIRIALAGNAAITIAVAIAAATAARVGLSIARLRRFPVRTSEVVNRRAIEPSINRPSSSQGHAEKRAHPAGGGISVYRCAVVESCWCGGLLGLQRRGASRYIRLDARTRVAGLAGPRRAGRGVRGADLVAAV